MSRKAAQVARNIGEFMNGVRRARAEIAEQDGPCPICGRNPCTSPTRHLSWP